MFTEPKTDVGSDSEVKGERRHSGVIERVRNGNGFDMTQVKTTKVGFLRLSITPANSRMKV